MPVPLLDVQAQNLALRAELEDAFRRVLESGVYILGPEVEAFEREFAGHVGATHAVGLSSGTDALIVALMALDIGPGDEVLVPAFTFFATAGAVARLGATPVFVDVRDDDFNIDPASAERKTTARTKAIIAVHLYGQSADMAAIDNLAARNGLAVVEDCAQAVGATFAGRACGTFGAFGTYSFYPTKNLGGIGEAGLVLTGDRALAERARKLRNHGSERRYYHSEVGGNFRLDALHAATLRVKLPYLDGYAASRAANAAAYNEAFAPLVQRGLLSTPAAMPGRRHVWNQYTVRIPDGRRDTLRDALQAKGIGCEVYYPMPLHEQQCFAALPAPTLADCPVSTRLSAEVLSLPCYPELAESGRSKVAVAVAAALGGA